MFFKWIARRVLKSQSRRLEKDLNAYMERNKEVWGILHEIISTTGDNDAVKHILSIGFQLPDKVSSRVCMAILASMAYKNYWSAVLQMESIRNMALEIKNRSEDFPALADLIETKWNPEFIGLQQKITQKANAIEHDLANTVVMLHKVEVEK